MAEPLFTFVHVTDTHYEIGSETLLAFVDAINSEKYFPLPDYIIHTGDIINGYKGTEAEHRREMTGAKSVLDQLVPETIVICHNHDTFGEPVRGKIFDSVFNTAHYRDIKRDGFYISIFSGAVGTSKYLTSWVPDQPEPEDVERVYLDAVLPVLGKYLDDNADSTALVFSHRGLPVRTPALNVSADHLQGYQYIKSNKSVDDFHSTLKNHGNVLAHYSGHVHLNAFQVRDGINYITTASLYDYPVEFRYVKVFEDSLVHTLFSLDEKNRAGYRWGPLIDADHSTPDIYYRGLPFEREFIVTLND